MENRLSTVVCVGVFLLCFTTNVLARKRYVRQVQQNAGELGRQKASESSHRAAESKDNELEEPPTNDLSIESNDIKKENLGFPPYNYTPTENNDQEAPSGPDRTRPLSTSPATGETKLTFWRRLTSSTKFIYLEWGGILAGLILLYFIGLWIGRRM